MLCSPENRKQWTLRLLADRMVELEVVDTISHETIRRKLKKQAQALVEILLVYSSKSQCGVCGSAP
jgi:hypothetical protein